MDKGKSLRQSLDKLKLFPVIAFDQSFVCQINEKTENRTLYVGTSI
jgi:hypothetical protein